MMMMMIRMINPLIIFRFSLYLSLLALQKYQVYVLAKLRLADQITTIPTDGEDNFQMPPETDYYPKRIHPCFIKAAKEDIILITSFNRKWYDHMVALNHEKSTTTTPSDPPWYRTILRTTFNYTLIIYHEDDLPDPMPLETACNVDLREEYDWLDDELMNSSSGLNRYYSIATFYDPCFVARKGYTKPGHPLMLKVGSINHAAQSAKTGQIIFWVDTDVAVREPLPRHVVTWLQHHDVTYIPFFLGKGQRLDLNIHGGSRAILLSDERWRVETGLFAVTVNEKTQNFTKKALSLYRGGMYELAKKCFQREDFCMKQIRVKYHVFLNDIFVFALLLHSDLHHDESIFSVNLKHGVFAMNGLPAWGPEGAIWGVRAFQPLFFPVESSTDIVTNFHIGQYIFHFFGFHDRGVLSVTVKSNAMYNASSWRKIENPGEEHGSLIDILEVPYMG